MFWARVAYVVGVAPAEAREQFGNSEEGEGSPLEAATK
jgi:hypothetical protein